MSAYAYPDEGESQHIPPNSFRDWSLDQIDAEIERAERRVASLQESIALASQSFYEDRNLITKLKLEKSRREKERG